MKKANVIENVMFQIGNKKPQKWKNFILISEKVCDSMSLGRSWGWSEV